MSEDQAQAESVQQTTGFESTASRGLDLADERRSSMNVGAADDIELPKPASEDTDSLELPEKFKGKSAQEIAKSYEELEKKFSSSRMKDAPESYEIALTDELTEAGIDFDIDSDQFSEFAQIAKESGMSNEQFNKLVNLYGKSYLENYKMSDEQVAEYKQEQLSQLGEDGPAIVEQLKTWGKNNLSESEYEKFLEYGDSAEGIKLLQKMIGNSSSVTVTPTGSNLNYTRDDLKTMMADKRYGSDLPYTRKVDGLFRQVYNQSQNFG